MTEQTGNENQNQPSPKKMPAVEFARKMLQLGELLSQVAQLETELTEQVLLLGRSQSIGNIEAKYSPGRTTYDWKATCVEHPTYESERDSWEVLRAIHTETIYTAPVSKTDWAAMAKAMGWPGIVSKPPVPTVKFNLLED